MAGGTYLCADRTEKFVGGLAKRIAAVATAVVSKPDAKNTTGSSVARASSTAWVALYTTSTRAPSACASASDFELPGNFNMSP